MLELTSTIDTCLVSMEIESDLSVLHQKLQIDYFSKYTISGKNASSAEEVFFIAIALKNLLHLVFLPPIYELSLILNPDQHQPLNNQANG